MPVLRVKQQPDAMPTITLNGCAPIPLAHYLKALGILRLVSEDSELGDPLASGCWANDAFILTSQLDRAQLIEFFVQRYKPTPILAPWNGGSGFYAGEVKQRSVQSQLRISENGRLDQYSRALNVARIALARNVKGFRAGGSHHFRLQLVLSQSRRSTRKLLIKAVEQHLITGKVSRDKNINALMENEAIKEFKNSLSDKGASKRIDLAAKWEVAGFKTRKRLVTEVLSSPAWDCLQREARGKVLTKLFNDELAESKTQLLQLCRNSFPEDALGWLDAVFVLGQDGAKFPPLLGTGGNDGRLEFTNNFMQRITEVMDPATGEPTAESARWLRAALFGSAAPGLATRAPVGQFFPGAAGGANATSGFDAPSAVNPWDYILMIEGALLFAAASVKRLESADDGALVYPFCVRQAGVGYASAAEADEAEARCEMWMPLWGKPTTLAELRAIFSEGRAQVRGRNARSGVDFAQAAVTLGVDRGIAAFQRYGFQVRNGLAYFATPLERVIVRRNARADLLADIEQWHDRLRQKAGPRANPEPPASVARALNQLERRIVELCRDDSPGSLQSLIAELGATERALARSFKWTTGVYLRPLHGLKKRWLDDANDNSPEFRLAQSVASTHAWLGKETFWFRQHLEPLEIGASKERSWVKWADMPTNDVAWHDGDLTDALNAMLARRLVRVEQSDKEGWPDDSPRPAGLGDITTFIEGRTNDALLADLIWGLSLLDWQQVESLTPDPHDTPNEVPSSFYAILRLCFRRSSGKDDAIPLVPAILQRAMNGDGKAASELAARRLRASGKAPLVKDLPVTGDIARRTAAAILFPISHRDFRLLERVILKQTKEQNI
jgi:CRISPR-associated protein Csx17